MKVAIVEIMPKGHSTYVQSLIKIFSSEKSNSIHLFTTSKIKDEIDQADTNLIFHISDDNVSILLTQLASEIFDKIYICTLEKYYKEFLSFRYKSPVYLTIHNIDEWFNFSFIKGIINFFYKFRLSPSLIYSFKKYFIYPIYREKIVQNILSSESKFVVLNEYLKLELSKYVPLNKINVIPFDVYDPVLIDQSFLNSKLRICIPGIISQTRRDYLSILNLFESNPNTFKHSITLDLLGSFSPFKDGEQIAHKISALKQNGYDIITYSDPFIPTVIFDLSLSKCDIILGNLNIRQGKYSFYGKTKETGITYTLIKAAKPGIIIEGYPIMNQLVSSIITYSNLEQLKELLFKILLDREFLNHLKKEAQKNSLFFEPHKIYNNIIKQ